MKAKRTTAMPLYIEFQDVKSYGQGPWYFGSKKGGGEMTYSTKGIRQVLRKLGFKPLSGGAATGHEVWGNTCGKTIRPLLRKKTIHVGSLFCLGTEIES